MRQGIDRERQALAEAPGLSGRTPEPESSDVHRTAVDQPEQPGRHGHSVATGSVTFPYRCRVRETTCSRIYQRSSRRPLASTGASITLTPAPFAAARAGVEIRSHTRTRSASPGWASRSTNPASASTTRSTPPRSPASGHGCGVRRRDSPSVGVPATLAASTTWHRCGGRGSPHDHAMARAIAEGVALAPDRARIVLAAEVPRATRACSSPRSP